MYFCKLFCFFIGQIISEGGAKLLLVLYKECNPEGKIKAAHGLARLGVCSDPDIAFPGIFLILF